MHFYKHHQNSKNIIRSINLMPKQYDMFYTLEAKVWLQNTTLIKVKSPMPENIHQLFHYLSTEILEKTK